MGMVDKMVTVNWRDILKENIKYNLKGTTITCSLLPAKGSTFTVRLCTPAFITRFPRLVVDYPETDDPKEYKKLTFSVDLTMQGASTLQHEFKALLDFMDDSLLDFIVDNQHLLGEAGKSREKIEGMQNKLFRTRVSPKSGRQFDDSFQPRAKAFTKHGKNWYKNSVAQFDIEGNPTHEEIEPGQVVQTFIRYDGVYCNAAIGFGHSFTLLAVKNLGDPSVYDPTVGNEDNATSFFEFPDVTPIEMPQV
jgi:hypothetical protein